MICMKAPEIRAELASRNMTIRDLAEATGIPENYLTKSLGKAARKIQIDELEAIKKALFDGDDQTQTAALRRIPLLGDVPAGKYQPA